MKKYIIFIIFSVSILLLLNSLFFFSDREITGNVIINNTSEIPENKSVGDCWEVIELNKTICYEGKKSVSSGEVIE